MDVKRELDDNGKIRYKVTSEKTKVVYTISKAENGYSQYVFSLTSGNPPVELSGAYTTPDVALRALEKHLAKRKDSIGVRRDRVAKRVEERKKANASKSKPNRKDPVQQGSAD